MVTVEEGRALAEDLDARDALGPLRDSFLFPRGPGGAPVVYLTGNSLGLQPRTVKDRVQEVLDDWAGRGVEGHVQGDSPWRAMASSRSSGRRRSSPCRGESGTSASAGSNPWKRT